MAVPAEPPGGTGPRILLVDVNRNIREFCRRALEREGYRVRLAGTGNQVFEAVSQEVPDLIILDIGGPRMNGLEVMQQLLVRLPHVRVILYSADRSYRTDPRVQRARAFVEKTESLTELKAVVARVLAGVGQRESG